MMNVNDVVLNVCTVNDLKQKQNWNFYEGYIKSIE